MSAKTPWFLCGHCGFRNHPRVERGENGQTRQADQSKCEQCGSDRDHEFATDYEPT